MTRVTIAALAALCILATPAQAFQTCDHAGTTVTATFGTEPAGTLKQVGTQIHTEDGQCDGATTANTATIQVVGDGDHETLTIDLSGGTFPGGVVDEAGTSDEVEIHVDMHLGGKSSPPDVFFRDLVLPAEPPEVFVLGTAGADHVAVGTLGPDTPQSERFSVLNLNRDEATDDHDVIFDDKRFIEVRGLGGADVLSAADHNGTRSEDADPRLIGGAGADDLTSGYVEPGPGSDTVRRESFHDVVVSYLQAPNPISVTPTGTVAGGDGEVPAGTDAYVFPAGGFPSWIVGSNNDGDVATAAASILFYNGAGGIDTINGGSAGDRIRGGEGADVLHGNGGDDQVYGDGGDDDLFGDADDDQLEGGPGDDDEDGGIGDDFLDQYGLEEGMPKQPDPNGADDLVGGPGFDGVLYGTEDTAIPEPLTFGQGRTAGVNISLDDVADDGAAGEGDNTHSDIEIMAGGVGPDTVTGSAADNYLLAWGGNDTVNFRGGGADTALCGAGADLVRADASDTADEHCDVVQLTDPPPPDPPVTPPSDPPTTPPIVTPPVQPPVVPLPPVVTPAPKVSALLSLPSSRRCASRHKFTVRVRREIRGTVRRVTIFVNGRRVKTVTGTRIGLPIDLRGLPKGRIRVRLQVQLADGRTATDTRTYRTCATRKRKGQFGRRRG